MIYNLYIHFADNLVSNKDKGVTQTKHVTSFSGDDQFDESPGII